MEEKRKTKVKYTQQMMSTESQTKNRKLKQTKHKTYKIKILRTVFIKQPLADCKRQN